MRLSYSALVHFRVLIAYSAMAPRVSARQGSVNVSKCRHRRQGVGRTSVAGILNNMTRALDAAIAKLAGLSPEEQDRIARWLLAALEDEDRWARGFATSQDALSKLAAEARADRAAGRTTELDPDKL